MFKKSILILGILALLTGSTAFGYPEEYYPDPFYTDPSYDDSNTPPDDVAREDLGEIAGWRAKLIVEALEALQTHYQNIGFHYVSIILDHYLKLSKEELSVETMQLWTKLAYSANSSIRTYDDIRKGAMVAEYFFSTALFVEKGGLTTKTESITDLLSFLPKTFYTLEVLEKAMALLECLRIDAHSRLENLKEGSSVGLTNRISGYIEILTAEKGKLSLPKTSEQEPK